jgi:hypothetical protein
MMSAVLSSYRYLVGERLVGDALAKEVDLVKEFRLHALLHSDFKCGTELAVLKYSIE